MWSTVKDRRNTPIVFYASLILLCLVLVSTYLTGGIFARYVVTSNGSDGSRVAVFKLTDDYSATTIMSIPEDVYPGFSYDIKIKVKNEGEVTLAYSITVTKLTDNLPLTCEPVSATLAPGSGETDVILTVKWDESVKDHNYMNKTELLQITVRAAQVD